MIKVQLWNNDSTIQIAEVEVPSNDVGGFPSPNPGVVVWKGRYFIGPNFAGYGVSGYPYNEQEGYVVP